MQMATSALHDARTRVTNTAAASTSGGTTDAAGQGTASEGDLRLLLLLAVNNADKAPKPASFEHRLLMMHKFAGDIQKAWRGATQQTDTTTRTAEQEEGLGRLDEIPVDIGLTTHPYFHEKSAAIATSPEYSSSSPANPSSSFEPHAEQIFLAGFDTLIRIFNPKYYRPPVPEAGVEPPPPGAPDKTPIQIALDPFFARVRLRITMRTDDEWGGEDDQLQYVKGLVDGDELDKVGGRREWARRVDMVRGMVGSKEEAVVSSTLAREAVKAKDWTRLGKLVPEGVAGLIERGEVSW